MEQATSVALIALVSRAGNATCLTTMEPEAMCSQVALTMLIGLPICMLVKRTRATDRVMPSALVGKHSTEHDHLTTTGDINVERAQKLNVLHVEKAVQLRCSCQTPHACNALSLHTHHYNTHYTRIMLTRYCPGH